MTGILQSSPCRWSSSYSWHVAQLHNHGSYNIDLESIGANWFDFLKELTIT